MDIARSGATAAGLAAPSPGSADPLAAVSFARRSQGCPKPRMRDQAPGLIIMYAFMVLGAPMIAIIRSIRPMFPTGLPRALWLGLIPIVFFAILLTRRATGRSALPKFADPERRIHALMTPKALDRYGPVLDEDFEPESIQAPLPMPERWYEWAAIAGAMVAGATFGAAIPWFGQSALIFACGGMGGVLAMAAIGVVRQTWYRFLPGRLDILEFRPWRAEAVRVRSYDLRNPAMVLDLTARRLVLDVDGRMTTVPLAGIWDLGRAAHLILRAAVSTAPTPEVPMDRLHD